MNHHFRRRRAGQSGFMLIEVLISILVFSLGVLALVGLQTISIKQSTEAKYRADAVMLANEIIGQMWVTDRRPATINQFATGGPQFLAWVPRVQSALPGVAGANLPDITPTLLGAAADPSTQVLVTVRWKAPNEPAADPAHSVTVVAQIK
jgi:type IV pilus assembly protein PilV